ncbi:neprilysin-2 isoform X2 [Rhipicephalus sanguineus]|uniref:neprilysin-2 isoform X2 n=1 Tax=Rhipicephalus sanguineus TaxID=34632 RepID=UPI0018952D1D|nr:neprilysin-2 isoform X2 [Rhipicephalus sanguineus]
MSAQKNSVGDFARISKLFLGAFLLLWVLWIMFGYRSNLVRRGEREYGEIVHSHARTIPPKIGPAREVTTLVSVKTTTGTSVSKKRTRSSKFRDICWKPQCIAIADIISDGFGKSRPCDNFFDFVCGQRAENNEVPPSSIKDSAAESLLRILENPKAKGKSNSTAVGKFTAAYMSCINKGNKSLQLQVSIQKIFHELGFDDWSSSSKQPTNENNDTIGNIWGKIGLHPFFDYNVEVEPKKPSSKRTITITKRTDFFLLHSAPSLMKSHSPSQKSNGSSGSLARPENIAAEQYSLCKKQVAEIIRLTNANVTQKESMETADEILTFEGALAKLSKDATVKRIEINMTSENGTASSANFSLRTMLEKELRDINATLKDNIRVILEYPAYYAGLIKFVSTVNSTKAIKNYIAWTYIRALAGFEGTPLHDIYLTSSFNTTNLTRSSAKNDVRTPCLMQLLKPETMLNAGASLYIKYNFDKYDRNDVQKMMQFIKESFKMIILKNKWMTEWTKNKAAERLAKMETVIGYPDWMLDDTVVDELYRFIPLLNENTSFAEHIFWIQANTRHQEILKLSEDYKQKEFSAVSLFSHPYYIERSDTLVLPAAAIAPRYRRPPVPRALNFGTVGALASMLMANAIDRFDTIWIDDGKGLGGKAVTKEFWDEESKEIFCNYSSCLKNKQCTDVKNQFKSYGEAHFTDYIGLRASYMALKNSVNNYTRPYLLRGADFNTEDKIFFLAFGNLFCPFSITKPPLTGRSDESVMSQLKETYRGRLNGAVKGYYGFQEAYKCNATADACKLLPVNSGSSKKG